MATPLNYHHLYYFWAVAKEGKLTAAATRLHVSQSALSIQIRRLEEALGETLFIRQARNLKLTEAGRIAFDYAEGIFTAGSEMMATLKEGRRDEQQVLRIGSVATLSRNFQQNFIRPVLARDDVALVLQSGAQRELLAKLAAHALDIVLSNREVQGDSEHPWRCRRIARQPVSLIGRRRRRRSAFRFPDDMHNLRLLLPGPASEIRGGFDVLCEQIGLRCRIAAEVDDMAMLRLLTRDGEHVALMPSVVVRDELRGGLLEEYAVIPQLYENFYAITVQRQFQHPLLRLLLARKDDEILAAEP